MARKSSSSPMTYGLWMGVGSTLGTILALLLLGILLGSSGSEPRDDTASLTTGAASGGCWP